MVAVAARRLAVVACLAVPLAVGAQEPDAADRCQTLEEVVLANPQLSLAQLRFNTMQQARSSLLASLGAVMSSTTEVRKGTVGDSTFTVMAQGISQETTGWITRDTVLAWRTNDGGRTYTMNYQGCARTMVGKRDPSFFVEVTLDKDPAAYVDNGQGQRDSIVITTKTSKPAFLTVFFRTADTMTVLYPSAAIGSPFRKELTTGGELRVPPAGNRLRTVLRGGSKRSIDWIVVVATRQEVPLSLQESASDTRTLQRLSWHEYARWLNQIPLEDRFVVERPFSIERTKP
jgi:hypothetical protein